MKFFMNFIFTVALLTAKSVKIKYHENLCTASLCCILYTTKKLFCNIKSNTMSLNSINRIEELEDELKSEKAKSDVLLEQQRLVWDELLVM